MNIPRIVIAGTSSGVGKTSITCGIIHSLIKHGYTVQPFKVGPDYIDPQYLSIISKKSPRNLDPWLMGKSQVLDTFVKNSRADMSVIEGVMGFYDGYSGTTNHSSTHHVAEILKAPVILILDASKAARSVAATAQGFKNFHKNSHIRGIILNKISTPKHARLCKDALEQINIPVVGVVPKQADINLSSRHLGLINDSHSMQKIKQVASTISDFIDLDLIIKYSKSAVPIKFKSKSLKKTRNKITIGVALDDSFNFYYNDNLDALRYHGAKLEFFSPTSDTQIPQCHGLYLGGGYPEVLGDSLSKNTKMRRLVKKLALDNIPLYAECGGLMYLTRSITSEKKCYNMVGLYDLRTRMTKTVKLNYTKGNITNHCLLSSSNRAFHGHEYHYSEITFVPNDMTFAYDLTRGHGIIHNKDGIIQDNTLASYGHLYFPSCNFANEFVNQCIIYSRH